MKSTNDDLDRELNKILCGTATMSICGLKMIRCELAKQAMPRSLATVDRVIAAVETALAETEAATGRKTGRKRKASKPLPG